MQEREGQEGEDLGKTMEIAPSRRKMHRKFASLFIWPGSVPGYQVMK